MLRGQDAPKQQIGMYNDLVALRPYNPPLADAFIRRLQSHLWYVSEEITTLALTSDLLTSLEKEQVAARILA